MPSFSLTSLLIVFTAVVLWFSTFAGYPGADDVRALILLSILITSGVAAFSFSARRRAFWIGFFGTMLMTVTRGTFNALGARFQWAMQVSRDLGQLLPVEQINQGRAVMAVHATIIWGLMIAVAIVIGILCVKVYDCSRTVENSKRN